MWFKPFSASDGETTMPTFSESSESAWDIFSMMRSDEVAESIPLEVNTLSIARRSARESRASSSILST